MVNEFYLKFHEIQLPQAIKFIKLDFNFKLTFSSLNNTPVNIKLLHKNINTFKISLMFFTHLIGGNTGIYKINFILAFSFIRYTHMWFIFFVTQHIAHYFAEVFRPSL